MQKLLALFGASTLEQVRKELRRLHPSKRILLSLFDTLKTVKASDEVQGAVQEYCRERGCDPTQPPLARHLHRRPANGDERIYNVQYNAEDRPFLRLPLDPLGRPEQVLVVFKQGRVELSLPA